MFDGPGPLLSSHKPNSPGQEFSLCNALENAITAFDIRIVPLQFGMRNGRHKPSNIKRWIPSTWPSVIKKVRREVWNEWKFYLDADFWIVVVYLFVRTSCLAVD